MCLVCGKVKGRERANGSFGLGVVGKASEKMENLEEWFFLFLPYLAFPIAPPLSFSLMENLLLYTAVRSLAWICTLYTSQMPLLFILFFFKAHYVAIDLALFIFFFSE
ncbi:unnamed protein product [Camellia sinensis]